MTTSGETIRDLQDQVNRALLASDTQTLHDLVAPGARIIGLRGFLIGRDEWIGVHEGGDFRQERLEVADTEVVSGEESGIRVDVVDFACLYKGERITGRFRVTQSWVTRDGRWQLVGLQYTALQG